MRIKENYNIDKLFFTSDTHFRHKNAIELCNRPFKDLEEMDNTLIENWNSVVPEDGITFHLGDFAFTGKIDTIGEIVSKLIGNYENICICTQT